jgi:hypothetical protein
MPTLAGGESEDDPYEACLETFTVKFAEFTFQALR